MIIRNKFNGYGFDGSRLCHDPVSLSIAATQAGIASSAAAAAAAPAIIAPTLAATGTAAAAQTAGLELAKQQAIQAGTQQLGQQAAQQAGVEATKQVGAEAAKQGIAQAGQQVGTEAAKQGIFSANPAGMPPTAGAPVTPAGPAQPLPPAGPSAGTPFTPPTMANTPPVNPNSMEYLKQTYPEQFAQNAGKVMPRGTAAQSAELPQYLRGVDKALPEVIPPEPTGADAVLKAQSASQQTAQFTPEVPIGGTGAQLPPSGSALERGIQTGLQFVKDNPNTTAMGLMSAGQYLNQPEKEDKDKYKNKVDMSGFQASTPTQRSFTPSYEYQDYAVGGAVEQMAAQNAVGANTGYPMAGLQTPMYSNPAMQRPQATNVVAPSADAGINTYTGEPRFAEGGLSAAERREYGLRTRGERAARNLTASYEEMEAERQKEAMKLMNERSDPGIVPRSRTQMLSSPFSAAMAEHARLGKKSKVPVVQMPKTNLGDIDNYMDIPIEAASGGIMHGLGGYSDGGRLLKGPGDGVSDSIPAVIGKRQPARLADGEFVIPARIVSELGNGSTEAGARKLYAMMERVQASRKKSIGKKKVAVNSKSDKHLPA
jgi:hypothetical protein